MSNLRKFRYVIDNTESSNFKVGRKLCDNPDKVK